MSAERLAICRERAAANGVTMSLFQYDRFFESYSEVGSEDTDLTQRFTTPVTWCTCGVAIPLTRDILQCPQSRTLRLLMDELMTLRNRPIATA